MEQLLNKLKKGNYFVLDADYNFVCSIEEGIVYEREDTCNGCGQCCKALTLDNRNPENGMCVYLKDNKCVLHGKEKPLKCKIEPILHDRHIDLDCSFKFKEVGKLD